VANIYLFLDPLRLRRFHRLHNGIRAGLFNLYVEDVSRIVLLKGIRLRRPRIPDAVADLLLSVPVPKREVIQIRRLDPLWINPGRGLSSLEIDNPAVSDADTNGLRSLFSPKIAVEAAQMWNVHRRWQGPQQSRDSQEECRWEC